MKRWFALTAIVLTVAACRGAEDWVAQELQDATQSLAKKQYGRAFQTYHNLLMVNRMAPLDAEQADQAKRGLASIAAWVKVKNPNAPNAELTAHAKAAGLVQVGAAWMSPEAKARLTADAARSLEEMAQAAPCADCKGQGFVACTSCDHGKHQCLICRGTGRTGGAISTTRGTTCLQCNGTGKLNCQICGGSGFVICTKCGGTALGN